MDLLTKVYIVFSVIIFEFLIGTALSVFGESMGISHAVSTGVEIAF